jgi:hypothetical protein
MMPWGILQPVFAQDAILKGSDVQNCNTIAKKQRLGQWRRKRKV